MIVDLHSHTQASDGLFSAERLIAEAVERKVDVLAVTDHDTLDGIAAAEAAAAGTSLRVLPGIEITCHVDATEIHLLGLGIRPAAPGLAEWLRLLRDQRVERLRRIAAALEALGMAIDVTPYLAPGRAGTVGRPHIARLLVENGYARGFDDAFDRFLSPGRPAFVERVRMPADEAIRRVHGAGGVAVQAHPGQMGDDRHLERLVGWGLDGLEVYHPDHTPEMRRRYVDAVDRFGLIATGGSDFHGDKGHGAPLGVGRTPDAEWKKIEVRISRASRDPGNSPAC